MAVGAAARALFPPVAIIPEDEDVAAVPCASSCEVVGEAAHPPACNIDTTTAVKAVEVVEAEPDDIRDAAADSDSVFHFPPPDSPPLPLCTTDATATTGIQDAPRPAWLQYEHEHHEGLLMLQEDGRALARDDGAGEAPRAQEEQTQQVQASASEVEEPAEARVQNLDAAAPPSHTEMRLPGVAAVESTVALASSSTLQKKPEAEPQAEAQQPAQKRAKRTGPPRAKAAETPVGKGAPSALAASSSGLVVATKEGAAASATAGLLAGKRTTTLRTAYAQWAVAAATGGLPKARAPPPRHAAALEEVLGGCSGGGRPRFRLPGNTLRASEEGADEGEVDIARLA